MECEIIIDSDCKEKIIIYANKNSALIEEIKRLAEQDQTQILGYKNSEAVLLECDDIYCVTTIDGKVYAICQNESYLLKERLYLLEERLPAFFVKINQSCLANIHKMERFDSSVSGTLKIRFKNGYTDYVSRRQLKTIKKRLGL